MASTNLLFAVLAVSGKSEWLFATAVILDDIAAAFATVAFVAFISLLVDRTYTATQYALLASIGTAGRTILAASSGWLVDSLESGGTLNLQYKFINLGSIPIPSVENPWAVFFVISLKSEVVTQILYGETFKKIKKNGSWLKIKTDLDNYRGFLREKKFPINQKNTHKIFNLTAPLYSKPNIKSKMQKKLSFSSKIRIVEKKNGFYKFDNYWIRKKDLKPINYITKDIFKYVKKFINIKYKWGGRHFTGIDCSGLIQLFFNFNNKFCPRDTKDQIKYFKKKIKLNNIKKNDLIFWKGHVAIAKSKYNLIHAYGPLKKTLIMPTNKTIDRIYKTANLKVIGIKRFI